MHRITKVHHPAGGGITAPLRRITGVEPHYEALTMVDMVITEILPGAITALADNWELENAEWPPAPGDWGGWVRYWCVRAIYGALYLVNAVLDLLDFLILHPFYAAMLMASIAAIFAAARALIRWWKELRVFA